MTIYHFTSIDSFFKIISSGRIFISNLKNSNDPSEGKYQLEAMRNELRKYNRNFSLFYQNTMHNDDLSMYCLSFSSYLNNIHNWMEYGQYGEGIAIGFDYKKLLNKLKRENLSFLEVQKVVYSKQKLKKIIEEVIVDDKNDEVDLGLIQKLLMIYVAFKHDAYSIEKEYRIVFVTKEDENRLEETSPSFLSLDCKTGNFSLCIRDLIKEDIINVIVLGSNVTLYEKKCVDDILKLFNYNVKLEESDVPVIKKI